MEQQEDLGSASAGRSQLEREYGRLQELLQSCGLPESLVDVWELARHEAAHPPTRDELLAGVLGTGIRPWQLSALVREVLFHAVPNGPLRLNTRERLGQVGEAINKVDNLSGVLRLQADDGVNEVLFFEALRMAHRQIPSQNRADMYAMVRCFKVFGTPAMSPMLERRTGLTIREFTFLGIAVSGHLARRFDINSDQDYEEFGVTKERAAAFFDLLKMDWRDIGRAAESQGGVDENWSYMWNPLESTPFVAAHPAHPNRLYCPVPQLLFRRFGGGLYYDLVDEEGFNKAFGDSIEAYVGELLALAFSSPSFRIQEEKPYLVKKVEHRGPDWILGDAGGNLFIECKGKRLSHEAKSAGGDEKLREEVGKLADFIVQNYKNVVEAMAGKSHWERNSNPCWPLLLTFEDWYINGPVMYQVLDNAVRERLTKKKLDPTLIETMPYSVMSCREFELAMGVIADVGITRFFRGKQDGDLRSWLWPDYQAKRFPKGRVIHLMRAFSADLKTILPEAVWPSLDNA
ncbi:hypothetical protein [Mitsuaria sp. 7]|uniref:hypothetical protein n=1 Tax=Mitsuaria sp. 7 TaxID=1658665 RepID=UPI0007DD9437|nr:hypothetical protein [Mitsuaria sp. 7]ANH69639.1 hypothetical protein ABE85_22370 [Mitsuaria sp. 7]